MRDSVLGKNVGIEETANCPAIQVLCVVVGLGLTCCRTSTRVEWLAVVEELRCDESVALNRCIDRRRVKEISIVPGNVVDVLGIVSIGSCLYDLEVIRRLAIIGSSIRSHRGTPVTTFDVCGRSWVWTGVRRQYGRITLEVNIESNTATKGIAFGSAALDVI